MASAPFAAVSDADGRHACPARPDTGMRALRRGALDGLTPAGDRRWCLAGMRVRLPCGLVAWSVLAPVSPDLPAGRLPPQAYLTLPPRCAKPAAFSWRGGVPPTGGACQAPLKIAQATTRPLRATEHFHPLRWRGSVIRLDSQDGGYWRTI